MGVNIRCVTICSRPEVSEGRHARAWDNVLVTRPCLSSGSPGECRSPRSAAPMYLNSALLHEFVLCALAIPPTGTGTPVSGLIITETFLLGIHTCDRDHLSSLLHRSASPPIHCHRDTLIHSLAKLTVYYAHELEVISKPCRMSELACGEEAVEASRTQTHAHTHAMQMSRRIRR